MKDDSVVTVLASEELKRVFASWGIFFPLLFLVRLRFGHFGRVFTHAAHGNGHAPRRERRINGRFLRLSLYFCGFFLQYRLRTPAGVPRTELFFLWLFCAGALS